jgi:hypothetical protein
MKKEKIFIEMKMISESFGKNADEFPLFRPEFLATQKINNIIENANILSRELASEMLQIINDLNSVEHYDGSGWLDFKMHLNYFLRKNGFKVEWTQKEMFLK